MASLAAPLLLLAAIHVGAATSSCSNVSALAAGVDTLLAEYERSTPPAAPTVVRVALDVRHASVFEGSSVVRLLADLHLYWTDPRIAWNVSDWDCDSLLVPAERLWLPDVELLNGAAGSGGDGDGSLRARIGADSSVTWITRLDVSVPIAMDLRSWPNDVQHSVFKFGSREHTIEELDLQVNDYKYATVWESGSWEIESVSGVTVSMAGAWRTRGVAEWSVRLRRRAAAHALSARAVLAAAVLLLIAAAVLPPGERPALCACAALTAALWLISALLRLPGSSTCPSALAVMAGVCGGAGACAAGSALAARVARLARGARPPPPQLRTLLAHAPAWCVATDPTQEHPESASATWAAAARLLDNALRAALALLLLVLVCLSL